MSSVTCPQISQVLSTTLSLDPQLLQELFPGLDGILNRSSGGVGEDDDWSEDERSRELEWEDGGGEV